MLLSGIYTFALLFQIHSYKVSLATEPMCSKFSCQEQLLEKMIRTEIKIESIENEIKKTQNTVLDTLSEVKKTVDNIMEEMEGKTKDMEQREEFFRNAFEGLRTNFTNDMENQKNSLNEFRENMKKPSVAFYANHVTDLALRTDKIIVFDTTITNEGSGYDASTGIFTAPVGGLYQFTTHVCVHNGKHSFIGLVVEGNVIAKDSNYDLNYYTCSSVGAVVRVKSGEQVWIKCTSGSSSYKLYEDSTMTNSFSGILLNN
ncbi:uncharacterized protein LOC128546317 [Mercenaria mercenaria]|uniref:uncharacterized protein LOC128546317 n=1 Tax=Mercenaria mercenaria TaxID=6596 RepID=UPI00234F7193|nr:uncharacterized protein LOC128546317 [Mercenaria mercenaria]